MTAHRRFVVASALWFGIAQPLAHASEPLALYTQRLLSEAANQSALAAMHACREKGYSVAVAVVDRGGIFRQQCAIALPAPHTPETAFRKAWTANSFRQSTADLAEFLAEGIIPHQVQHNPGALLVGGGLVVQVSGEVVGGIGVAGAPPGKTERDSIDGACAQSGLDAVREALEFAD